MKNNLDKLNEQFAGAVRATDSKEALENLKVTFLGRKGLLAQEMKTLGGLSIEEKKTFGEALNKLKEEWQSTIDELSENIEVHDREHREEREWIDITAPGVFPASGHLHLVSEAINEITDIFTGLGFVRINAPEVDWDYYAFESLNMPSDHPARDDWETFFIADIANQKAKGPKGRIVLTPHTSNSQVREMERGELPIRMININRTYRRQSDVTHSPMFHQFEGLCVMEGLNIADLKGVLDYFAKAFFGPTRRIRLRPHHFRFTEPSFEVDISCGVCGAEEDSTCRVCKTGWVELGGAGMVHPNVLKAGGLDPNVVSGFAFGWGVERTLMMREGLKIDDIRKLYRNDLRFLRQF